MCGIAGWLGEDPSREEGARRLASAADVLQHRGPDDTGAFQGESFGLAFQRLAIMDLTATGHQPMTSRGGRYVLVMNGEIYNHVELRRELQAQGVRFDGTSDTEVLLHLLAQEGKDALARCNGMFAFAFVDVVARRFLLGRDRLGVKPLYYVMTPSGGLRFASELKALLTWPDADCTLDQAAVAAFLAHGHVPGDICIFAGYAKLAPGHVLEGDTRRPTAAVPRRYWAVAVEGDEPVDLDELEALLEDAVRVRLRSDVPVGVFLSGGLDSGLVAAFAGRVSAGDDLLPPLARTVGFDDAAHDESSLAARSAAAAGLPHVVVVQDVDALRMLDAVAWHFDEPFADASALPTMALARAAREHAVVWLSGDGGDEAFAGYRRYSEAARYRGLTALPRPVAHSIRGLAGLLPADSRARLRAVKATAPRGGMAAAFDSTPEDPMVWAVAGEGVREHLAAVTQDWWDRWARARGSTLTGRQQALDYENYLPDDILVKVDRASMAHSVEVRSPFLDVRVVEWAAAKSRAMLLQPGQGKLPLRRLAARMLPPEVVGASKRGFAPPVSQWLRTTGGVSLVQERLLGDGAKGVGLWSAEGTARLAARHASGHGRSVEPLLWRLLVLEAWHRCHVGATASAAAPGLQGRRSA